VSATKNALGRNPVQRLGNAIAPSDRQRWHQGEWNARKHCRPKRQLWHEIQIWIEEKTLEIRTIEVTSSSIGDAPILPDLLNQIPPGQELGSVTADRAYDTRKCHDAIAARNTLAVIHPLENAKL
jgi:hypothetical protein